MSDIEQEKTPRKLRGTIQREVITVRPFTSTREAIRITITQKETDSGELALASWNIGGKIPHYGEKPDILEDLGRLFFVAAYYIRKFNKTVKNGK